MAMGIGEIAGMAGGGGSLFLALISLVIRLIYKKIKESRYRTLKAGLTLMGTKIDVENKRGNLKLKEKLEMMGKAFNDLAKELELGTNGE